MFLVIDGAPKEPTTFATSQKDLQGFLFVIEISSLDSEKTAFEASPTAGETSVSEWEVAASDIPAFKD